MNTRPFFNALLFAALFLLCNRAIASDLIVITSDNIHQNDTILVFSPSQVQNDIVPTLFLLHGRSGKYDSWSKHLDLQRLSDDSGWRIICPDGQEKSWYINCPQNRWRDFFWDELWPKIELLYPLDSSKTFITGLSMGGAGSINIFLDHPEKFRGAGSMSGSLDFLFPSTSARKEVPAMLVDMSKDRSKVNAESAVTRIMNADPQVMKDKMIVISCGTEDDLLPCSKLLEERCHEKGFPCVAIYNPGVHNWKYWTEMIEYHILVFNKVSARKTR